MSAVGRVVLSEWTKLRTLRSTPWTLLSAVVVGAGLAAAVSLAFRNASRVQTVQGEFDPLFATFYSLTFAQLAVVVFGVLLVGGEYSTGTIRASLMATPRRGLLYVGKIGTAGLVAAGVAAVTVLATFLTAQAALGPLGVSPGDPGVARAVAGAWCYLSLICLFAVGVTWMLRSSVISLAVLVPPLFVGANGLGNIPKVRTVAQFLPDQAGMLIMHILGSPEDPAFDRVYGPWTGVGILALWTAAALLGGYLVFGRRDA